MLAGRIDAAGIDVTSSWLSAGCSRQALEQARHFIEPAVAIADAQMLMRKTTDECEASTLYSSAGLRRQRGNWLLQ